MLWFLHYEFQIICLCSKNSIQLKHSNEWWKNPFLLYWSFISMKTQNFLKTLWNPICSTNFLLVCLCQAPTLNSSLQLSISSQPTLLFHLYSAYSLLRLCILNHSLTCKVARTVRLCIQWDLQMESNYSELLLGAAFVKNIGAGRFKR